MTTTAELCPINTANVPQTGCQSRLFTCTQPVPPITPPCSPTSVYPLRPPSVAPPDFMTSSSPVPSRSRSRAARESFSLSSSGGFRTLIVDDNPINLNILERTLKRHFSHLVAPDIALASSGNAALCQLASQSSSPKDEIPSPVAKLPTPTQDPSQNPFDLILLDIDMPDISGVEVAEQIRNVHNDQATAIVAVTTSTQPEQQRTYERVGMDGVVGKPIDLGVLDRVVTRALLSRQGRVRPRTSSVPPLYKNVLYRKLQRHNSDLVLNGIENRLSSSMLSLEMPALILSEAALARRGSFPFTLDELHQLNDCVRSNNVSRKDEADITEAMTTDTLIDNADSQQERSFDDIV